MEGELLDARAGGLIIGRNDDSDDIPMVFAVSVGIFQVYGNMQGGEYIINAVASTKYKERIEKINSYNRNNEYKPLNLLKVTDNTSVINTNVNPKSTLLLVDSGQFIINRAATAKYYDELEEINSSVNKANSTIIGS